MKKFTLDGIREQANAEYAEETARNEELKALMLDLASAGDEAKAALKDGDIDLFGEIRQRECQLETAITECRDKAKSGKLEEIRQEACRRWDSFAKDRNKSFSEKYKTCKEHRAAFLREYLELIELQREALKNKSELTAFLDHYHLDYDLGELEPLELLDANEADAAFAVKAAAPFSRYGTFLVVMKRQGISQEEMNDLNIPQELRAFMVSARRM